MWTAHQEELKDSRGLRFTIDANGQPATLDAVLRAWQTDAAFRSTFNSVLADVPYSAFRWETPPATDAGLTRPFEFVVLDSPALARPADAAAFAVQFLNAEDDIAVFANLGGDATMIVPSPIAEPAAYGHLAAFVRLAPERQRDALWRTIGEVFAQRLGSKPIWLSTAGAGVAWLHVRVDDRPKYYGYTPYRRSDYVASK
jgi:hypothetical protein